MSEHGKQRMWIAPIAASIVLIAISLSLLLGPAVGGGLGSVHAALRGLLTGSDRPAIDELLARQPLGERPVEVNLTPGMPAVLSPPLVMTETVPFSDTLCSGFEFEGSLVIQGGRLSFGRFNVVSNTDPWGRNDPLTSWKLVQMESVDLDLGGVGKGISATIPVDSSVTVLISDPYSQETLFSARWMISEIAVRGERGSINAQLAPNLSEIRVNNTISSATLDEFASVDSGVLVMHWGHTQDIAPALRAGEPVLAPIEGSVHSELCAR